MVSQESPTGPRRMGVSAVPMVVGNGLVSSRDRMGSWRLSGIFVAMSLGLILGGCSRAPELASTSSSTTNEPKLNSATGAEEKMTNENELATATFASGCYWCTEAVFQRLDGVENVVSGAMGGHVENPTYRDICSGTTGHAECIQFNYDPLKVNYETLLEVFWKTHDPTTLNKQGADEGPQYRSAVFYHSPEQQELAEKYKTKLDAAGVFDKPIVTEITAASKFYPAKADHQNFYNDNPNYGYCSYVIRPKIDKLEAVFAEKLKKSQ